ncbi:MAG: effector binding domain-containing protein [Bacteroidota bacterium]
MQNVNIKPFNVIGIAVRTSNVNGQAAGDIQNLWNLFLSNQMMLKIPNKLSNDILSLYTDYEGDHSQPYTAMLGCQVANLDNVPEGMVGKSFNGGDYAKMTAQGDLTKGIVVDQWMKIWEMDLKRKYTVDFEIYGEKAQNPNDAEVEFYIAV